MSGRMIRKNLAEGRFNLGAPVHHTAVKADHSSLLGEQRGEIGGAAAVPRSEQAKIQIANRDQIRRRLTHRAIPPHRTNDLNISSIAWGARRNQQKSHEAVCLVAALPDMIP